MLHIHNGDSTAGTAGKANIPGEHLAWREALVCGPAPGNLSAAEFQKVRARHLAESYGVEIEKCAAELQAQHDALAKYADHEEVVLWFEHDLFCQVQLFYLLKWFSGRNLANTKLSLICIGEFEGVEDFRGLGQLNEKQLASLFPGRRDVTPAQLELGSRAWRAYSSSTPAEIELLLQTDTSALPFLRAALTKHLERFPSIHNGLGRVANIGLELIADGLLDFKSLFPVFGKREPLYGLGDAQLLLELKNLATARQPLLTINNGAGVDPNHTRGFLNTSFRITDKGGAVLNGKEDFVTLNGIDVWLGGVHLEGNESQWRWDEVENRLFAR